MIFFSPAKLNLFFQVLHKRDDGYHEIASLMGAITLGDYLEICLASDDRLFCDDPSIPLGDDNLIWNAAHLFRQESHLISKLKIILRKRVPPQAGLGGGSSNAATTLWGLNELFQRPLSQKRLIHLSEQLGSDVPFFFSHGFAYVRGRGEKVTSLPPMTLPPCFVVKPRDSLATLHVYKQTNVNELPKRDLLRDTFFNDLEAAAFRLQPKLKTLKESLFSMGFSDVVMTGSGTAFVCFGHVAKPELPDVSFYKVAFLERNKEEWWQG